MVNPILQYKRESCCEMGMGGSCCGTETLGCRLSGPGIAVDSEILRLIDNAIYFWGFDYSNDFY